MQRNYTFYIIILHIRDEHQQSIMGLTLIHTMAWNNTTYGSLVAFVDQSGPTSSLKS